jgi:hypothetical protein
MTSGSRSISVKVWLVVVTIGLALLAGRCGRDVTIGVDPRSDAAVADAPSGS